jgi:hypothetical protein
MNPITAPKKTVLPVPYELIQLNHATVDEYCRAFAGPKRESGIWWYIRRHSLFGNFSLPFQDRSGSWWYQVKPWFCWPVEMLKAQVGKVRLPRNKSWIGFQHLTGKREGANSQLVLNVIDDLNLYDESRIIPDKRRTLRKGAKRCEVILLKEANKHIFQEALSAWNDLVARTGWKKPLTYREFEKGWKDLLDFPGTGILLAFERSRGLLAGWLIVRIFGGTAYVDTIASKSGLLGNAPNDILIYTFLRNAQRLSEVSRAYYSIKSMVEPLEKFKRSLGFEPKPFPATLCVRPGFHSLLKCVSPNHHKRLIGDFSGAGKKK